MTKAFLNLVVIRVPNLEEAHEFYSALGISFTKHAHGKGPEHYASEENGIVFEIYPQAGSEDSTKSVRIGFKVVGIAECVLECKKLRAKVISEVKESPWGLRAVIEDPFGHKIELVEVPLFVE